MDEDGKIMKKEDVIYVNSGLCKEIPMVTNVQVKRQDNSVAFRIYLSN